MKRILLSLTIIFTLLLLGCDINPIIHNRTNTSQKNSDIDIDYEVEKISMSKSYQHINPKIEVIKKDMNSKVLVSLGLMNSSGIDVTQIKKINEEINIHIKNQKKIRKSQIVNPQVLIDLKDIKYKDIENLNFNIINENYEPIRLKLGINEIIDKVNSNFNLSVNDFPDVNIISTSDQLLWDISYNNTFDKANINNPIINLSVLVDADTGDIVDSSKETISSFIDEGEILDYISDKFILYKKTKENKENKNIKSNLCIFDIDNNNTEIIYKSKADIQSAVPNSNFSYIGVLESNEENNEVYIVETNNKKAYKTSLNSNINPSIIRWKNNKELYIVDSKEESSNIYTYNIENNDFDLVSKVDKNIVDLKILNNSIFITEKKIDSDNLKFHLKSNWDETIFNDYGFKPNYINNNQIAYLKLDEESHNNRFEIYDLKEEKVYDSVDLNISHYFTLSNGNIILIEKNDSDNKYTMYKYNINEKSQELIATINNDNVYYNKNKGLLYIDHKAPFGSKKSQIIYSIDLDQLDK